MTTQLRLPNAPNTFPYAQMRSSSAVSKITTEDFLSPLLQTDLVTMDEFMEEILEDKLDAVVRFFHVTDTSLAFCDPEKDEPSGLLYLPLEDAKRAATTRLLEDSRVALQDATWDTRLGKFSLREIALKRWMVDDLITLQKYLEGDVWDWEIDQDGEITAHGGPVYGYEEAVRQGSHALLMSKNQDL